MIATGETPDAVRTGLRWSTGSVVLAVLLGA